MNIIENLPIPVSGLMLALFSLGNLYSEASPFLKYAFGLIAFIILVLLVLKLVFYHEQVKIDFKNPVIASSSGTFSMALMVSSTYLIPYVPSIAYSIWIIGIALHIILMIYFTYHFIISSFNISTVYPTYWIVYVGITMGAITSHAHNIENIGFLFFTAGFAGMLITTPLVIYRYIKHPEIPNMNKPLICIFTALFSILIVGYLNSAHEISYTFLTALYCLACIFYIFSLSKFKNYLKLEFYPSFAAFSFPFVISALATKEIATNVKSNIALQSILTIQSIIALLLVIYVLIRYLKFLKADRFKSV